MSTYSELIGTFRKKVSTCQTATEFHV